jgi:hypothetical protein
LTAVAVEEEEVVVDGDVDGVSGFVLDGPLPPRRDAPPRPPDPRLRPREALLVDDDDDDDDEEEEEVLVVLGEKGVARIESFAAVDDGEDMEMALIVMAVVQEVRR